MTTNAIITDRREARLEALRDRETVLEAELEGVRAMIHRLSEPILLGVDLAAADGDRSARVPPEVLWLARAGKPRSADRKVAEALLHLRGLARDIPVQIGQNELARKSEVCAGTVCYALSRLAKRGLLETTRRSGEASLHRLLGLPGEPSQMIRVETTTPSPKRALPATAPAVAAKATKRRRGAIRPVRRVRNYAEWLEEARTLGALPGKLAEYLSAGGARRDVTEPQAMTGLFLGCRGNVVGMAATVLRKRGLIEYTPGGGHGRIARYVMRFARDKVLPPPNTGAAVALPTSAAGVQIPDATATNDAQHTDGVQADCERMAQARELGANT